MSVCIRQKVYEPAGVMSCNPCKSYTLHAIYKGDILEAEMQIPNVSV